MNEKTNDEVEDNNSMAQQENDGEKLYQEKDKENKILADENSDNNETVSEESNTENSEIASEESNTENNEIASEEDNLETLDSLKNSII